RRHAPPPGGGLAPGGLGGLAPPRPPLAPGAGRERTGRATPATHQAGGRGSAHPGLPSGDRRPSGPGGRRPIHLGDRPRDGQAPALARSLPTPSPTSPPHAPPPP